MKATIIGIDCATKASKVGLALGRVDGSAAQLLEAEVGRNEVGIVDTVATWAEEHTPTLLALDAPLGGSLLDDSPGEAVNGEPNELFRRATDRAVKDRIGKQSLDVGANPAI